MPRVKFVCLLLSYGAYFQRQHCHVGDESFEYGSQEIGAHVEPIGCAMGFNEGGKVATLPTEQQVGCHLVQTFHERLIELFALWVGEASQKEVAHELKIVQNVLKLVMTDERWFCVIDAPDEREGISQIAIAERCPDFGKFFFYVHCACCVKGW